jgi:hypothetical protein
LFGVSLVTAASLMPHCGAGLQAEWLDRVFVTPQVHRWHHSAKVPDGHKYSVNYGVGLVVWDRLFGTYYFPRQDGVPVQPDKLGHPEGVADEGNYFKLFFLARYPPRWPRRPSSERVSRRGRWRRRRAARRRIPRAAGRLAREVRARQERVVQVPRVFDGRQHEQPVAAAGVG